MKCAHCNSRLHPIMFGAEIYTMLWRGKELELIHLLIRAGGNTVSIARIFGSVWQGEDRKTGMNNRLWELVHAVNVKLIDTEYWIQNEHGLGYRLERRGC